MDNFEIVLAKNRIARELKKMYLETDSSRVPEYIKADFDAIEVKTGVMGQPTGREILESNQDI